MLRTALLCLMLTACTVVNIPPAAATVYDGLTAPEAEAKKYSVELGENYCTGTIIGPHAILTATHCVDDKPATQVINDTRTPVTQYIEDGYDHTIMIVPRTYSTWAHIAPRPGVGSTVFMWGNSQFDDLFRRGVVAKYEDAKDAEWPGVWMLMDMLCAGGDSGSGIFNSQGAVVGVMTGVFSWDDRGSGAMGRVSVAMPFQFKPEQVRDVTPDWRPLTGS